jgi:hypothetical protein
MGDDFGTAPLRDKGPLHEVGGAHIVLRALGNQEVSETRGGLRKQAATGFGELPLLLRHDRLAPLLGLLGCRGIAPSDQQRCDRRPERRGDFLLEILPLVQPTPHP